jgi:hypothetical protein
MLLPKSDDTKPIFESLQLIRNPTQFSHTSKVRIISLLRKAATPIVFKRSQLIHFPSLQRNFLLFKRKRIKAAFELNVVLDRFIQMSFKKVFFAFNEKG